MKTLFWLYLRALGGGLWKGLLESSVLSALGRNRSQCFSVLGLSCSQKNPRILQEDTDASSPGLTLDMTAFIRPSRVHLILEDSTASYRFNWCAFR